MRKVLLALTACFTFVWLTGIFCRVGNDAPKGSQELLNARVSQTCHQFESFSNCTVEEDVTEDMAIWNPISASPSSGCIASGCGGSLCLASGCTGSICFGSGCGGSVCGASGCGASGCGGSICGGSGCAGSACTGSACGGSVCVGTACAGSVCVNCK